MRSFAIFAIETSNTSVINNENEMLELSRLLLPPVGLLCISHTARTTLTLTGVTIADGANRVSSPLFGICFLLLPRL